MTDVEDLHNWQVEKLTEHPMFARIPDSELADDPCIKCMREGTDEAKKVLRKGGQIWHAVFRKRDLEDPEDRAAVELQYLTKFYI